MRKPMQSAHGILCAPASFLTAFAEVQRLKSGFTRLVAAACLLLSFALAPAALAATSAKHEMTSNWVGSPASAPYGSALTAEWHINTNDANNPQANNPVNNVRLTLTATNGVFANMPTICKTTGVTPPSAISANGTQLLCNLGTVTEGTSTVVQTQILPNGVVGSTLSTTGSVTSDSAAAPTAPTAPSGLPITGSHGMDLAIGAPNQNYQQNTVASRSGGNRPSIMVDYGISMTAGSIPGPSTYTFTLDIAVSVAGQLPGLQWEGCAPIDDSAQAPGIPHSATSFTDRTNFPTCTISGSGTHYTVTLSGLDYSLQHVPTVDSLYQAIPSATNFIAAGQLIFSYTTPITATTGVTFSATPTPFTFIDNVTQPETNTANDVSSTTLVVPGVFSMIWMGSPSAGRVPWDANMWAAPGAAQNRVFPWPAAGSSTNPGPYSLSDQPLGAQADSVTWSTYSGPGGADMAGSCVLIQNPAAFTPRWVDFLAADGASYSNMPTAHLWYRTDTLNTKTATCGEPVGVAGSPWISAPLPAGCATQTASISPAYSDDQCIVSVPPGVTAVKMTWNPAVDKQFHHFLRVWGYVPTTAPIGAESWVAGTFNAPYNTATVFPGYPTLNNYINISTSPAVTGTIPGSTYGPNTNGIRDAMRIQGPNGAITKTASNPSALPGVPVTFTLSAEADLATVNPPAQTFTVVDTLPTGMTYVTGSGTPVPVLSVNGSGQQVLTYTFTNVPANVAQPITYQAQTAANSSITPGTVLTNTAQINVVGDNRAVAAKQVTASLTVPNNGATTLAKSVDSNLLSFLGDSSAWNLTINSQDSVSNSFTDTIDILPYAGDGRGTNISGTYTIGAVTAAGATVYYTSANPSTLSNDPRTASNGTAPGSIAGNTVGWTTTKPAAPTAIRVIGPALAPGASQTIRIAFTTPAGTSCAAPAPTDNKPGQLLVNSANSIAAHTGLPMLSSSTTTIGSCYSLALTKALTTNRFAAGDQFTVAIRTGSASGTVVNSTANSTTAGTGSTLTGGFGTTGAYSGTAANTAYFLTESGAGTPAAVLGNYTSTITCTDANGVQTGLPNNQPYSAATGFSITPVLGAVISCTIANTAVPSITVQKQVTSRILAADQFTVALKNSGGTVLTSATTSGTGNTATTVNWPVTQGATYTITDAMAAGSPNTLGAYVPSASCVNTTTGNAVTVGGTVGAWTVTGGSPGDAYVCTVINSPGPPITCNANPNIFNTGYNAGTGGILPDNSFDAHWQVAGPFAVTTPANAVSMPPANAVWAAANVGNMAPTAWSASPYGNAQWISQQTIANPNSPDGDWYYRYQFTMDPAVDPTSFSLAMNFLSDNSVMEVYVNGVAQSPQTTGLPQATSVPDPYQGIGYLTANAASTTLNHNWQTGLNTIIVQIKSGRPVEGFDAQVRPSSLCPAHVAIKKSTPATTVTPSGQIVYTIVASNTGASSAAGTVVADPIPTGIASQTWTCSASGGAVCPNASGTGALSQTLATFPGGSTVTYTVTGTVSANPPAHVTNTATASPPPGSLCTPTTMTPPCNSTVTVPPVPQVSIQKSTLATTLTPNGTVAYTIVVGNTGTVDASGTQVSDPIPAGITSQTWTCAASGGAACPNASGTGALSETLATFPANGSVTYTVAATISANPPAHVVNTATATPPTGGICTPGNTQPPCTSTVTVPPIPQVSITKTANTQTLIPGGTIVYTVVASNGGSVDAGGAQVSDPIPVGITAVSWTCAAANGAVCPNTSGSGALNQTIATFPAGSSLTYMLTATVSANPPAHVTNTATVTTTGLCLPNNTPPPCSGIVVTPPVPQVSITKTANTQTLTPGGTIVYTVVASNGGSVDAGGAQVSDPIPAGITAVSWTCAANGGAVCPNASGSGALNETIATFPVGSNVTYTLTATVSANPPAHVTNTATVTTTGLCLPNNTPPPCSGIAVTPPLPQVSITKTANTQTLTPGGTIVYTVVASNGGSVDANGAQVSDPIPAGITAVSWTCAANGGAVCPNANGTGALSQTIATFPAGSSVTYTLTATVSANPPAQVTNTATVTTTGLCLPNNTPPPCSGIVVTPPLPQVSITKTANTQTLTPGGTIVYTVVASNGGSVDASGAQVSDPIPAGITAVSWTCSAAGGAVCPNAT
ncbi:MAG: DUF11 domain-containing protein, partial [Rudaea sp.]|nr:DUF11 domain-containing protein [Rudaea sp.]